MIVWRESENEKRERVAQQDAIIKTKLVNIQAASNLNERWG